MAEVLGIPGDYRVGCVLAVPVKTEVGVVSHKGIFSDRLGADGLPMVIHNAKLFGHIIESTMTDYLLMAVGPLASEGYPGTLPPSQVLERARSQIEQPWRLWNNCEHFAAWAHDIPRQSPQLRTAGKRAAVATGVIGACVALMRLGR